MMARLTQSEKQLQTALKEIVTKEDIIKELQQKVHQLQLESCVQDESELGTLKSEYVRMQKKIYSMEKFLADYGMIWTGEENKEKSKEEKMWHPDTAHASATPVIDYDKILQNISDLNSIAGAGIAKVTHVAGGARLVIPDAVPLTLFRNGLMLFAGPFRYLPPRRIHYYL